jgi:hypothetical protein
METHEALTYQLWDTESGNAVGAYESESAAMLIVQNTYAEHGAQYVESLLLARSDTRDHLEVIADGEALVRRVRTGIPTRS